MASASDLRDAQEVRPGVTLQLHPLEVKQHGKHGPRVHDEVGALMRRPLHEMRPASYGKMS
jgi:hypothetical protein